MVEWDTSDKYIGVVPFHMTSNYICDYLSQKLFPHEKGYLHSSLLVDTKLSFFLDLPPGNALDQEGVDRSNTHLPHYQK